MKRIILLTLMLAMALSLPLSATQAQEDDADPEIFFDGTWGITMPDEWEADSLPDESALYIGSSRDVLNTQGIDGEAMPSGEVVIGMIGFTPDEIDLFLPPDRENSIIYEMVALFASFQDEEGNVSVPDLEETTINGRDAVVYQVSDEFNDIYFYATQVTFDHYAFHIIFTASGEMDSVLDDSLATLSTAFFIPELPETYEGDQLTITYPAGWAVAEFDSATIAVANEEDVLSVSELSGDEVGVVLLDLREQLGELEPDVLFEALLDTFIDSNPDNSLTVIEYEDLQFVIFLEPIEDERANGLIYMATEDNIYGAAIASSEADLSQVIGLGIGMLIDAGVNN